MARIPLGWLQLKRERARFAAALAGVAFAVVLILMQLGFREALFESSVRYHRAMDYDVVLVDPKTPYIVATSPFSRRRLYQALSVGGVEGVTPVYAAPAIWKNPWTHATRQIFVVGVDASDGVFRMPEVLGQLDKIRKEDVLIFDRASRPEYGPVADYLDAGKTLETEINNRRVRIEGLFDLGTSFGIDGSVLTSDVNFRRIFPDRDPGLIDLGLIRVKDGVDPRRVAAEARARLPGDVLVLTRGEFVAREKDYWDASTPIGYVFTFGVIVGILVGGIVVYQILFADVSDHLPQYATLKAMGYSNAAIASVVVEQAVVLGGLGYVPGFAVCLLLYRTASAATHLPIAMTWGRATGVLLLTVGMCIGAGVMALRRLRSADPAEVF